MKHKIRASVNADFAALYEASFTSIGSMQSGQMLETQVLSISKDTVFVQLNGKSEGIIPKDEFVNKDGELTVSIGDTIRVFFLQAKNGEMHFTSKISADKADPALLEQAYRNQIPVEGIVEKEIKGGFEIRLGEFRAFCPFSQMGPKHSESASEPPIGKHLPFIIQEYKESGRNMLVSNRAIHEAARQETVDLLKQNLHEGMVVKGIIKSIQNYGAFVDIGGMQALLPVSEIGRARVSDIRSVLVPGQEIEAAIIKLDWQNEKISISMKQLQADPWSVVAAQYPIDSKHHGSVVRLTDYGAFVSLEPGVDGLVHISELRTNSQYSNSKELSVKMGQKVQVQILAVDQAAKRISLKLAASDEEEATTAKYLGESSSAADTYNPFAALLKKQ
jgi:small subunit ribosomal protein S1